MIEEFKGRRKFDHIVSSIQEGLSQQTTAAERCDLHIVLASLLATNLTTLATLILLTACLSGLWGVSSEKPNIVISSLNELQQCCIRSCYTLLYLAHLFCSPPNRIIGKLGENRSFISSDTT